MKHMLQQPFVFATGVAALIHSTWSLGTFFAGEQPDGWHLIGWLLPALLIAFALDIGQIVTSTEIRKYGLTLARGVTFVVFALATYYLQWLYIAHHMPALELSAGISTTMRGVAIQLRDMAMWVIPALLPLSTLLYTFSAPAHEQANIQRAPEVIERAPEVIKLAPEVIELAPEELPEQPLVLFETPIDPIAAWVEKWHADRFLGESADDPASTQATRKNKKRTAKESE